MAKRELDVIYEGKHYGNTHAIAALTGLRFTTIQKRARGVAGSRIPSIKLGDRLYFPIDDTVRLLAPRQLSDDELLEMV